MEDDVLVVMWYLKRRRKLRKRKYYGVGVHASPTSGFGAIQLVIPVISNPTVESWQNVRKIVVADSFIGPTFIGR